MTENPDSTPEDLRAILAPEDLAWSDACSTAQHMCEHERAGYVMEIRQLKSEIHYVRKLVAALYRENKALRRA
jgi:hypothetical protein